MPPHLAHTSAPTLPPAPVSAAPSPSARPLPIPLPLPPTTKAAESLASFRDDSLSVEPVITPGPRPDDRLSPAVALATKAPIGWSTLSSSSSSRCRDGTPLALLDLARTPAPPTPPAPMETPPKAPAREKPSAWPRAAGLAAVAAATPPSATPLLPIRGGSSLTESPSALPPAVLFEVHGQLAAAKLCVIFRPRFDGCGSQVDDDCNRRSVGRPCKREDWVGTCSVWESTDCTRKQLVYFDGCGPQVDD